MSIEEIQSIQSDDKGMIQVDVNGVQRRFIKEKFIEWVTKNNISIPSPKRPKKKRTKKAIKQPCKKPVKVDPRRERKYQRLVEINRKGKQVIAKKADEVFGPFISLAACEKATGITKSWIRKCINEGKETMGFTFEKVIS